MEKEKIRKKKFSKFRPVASTIRGGEEADFPLYEFDLVVEFQL